MRRMMSMSGIVLTAAMLMMSAGAQGQTTAGPIRLIVDASEAPQKILHVKMGIPVTPEL